MYASVRRYTMNSGANVVGSGLVEKGFIPIIKKIPGFVSYSLIDGGSENGRDVLITVSVFESREGVEESVAQAAQWVGANLAAYEPSKPMIAQGTVLASASR